MRLKVYNYRRIKLFNCNIRGKIIKMKIIICVYMEMDLIVDEIVVMLWLRGYWNG